jgi:hypothetical protein
VEIKRKSRRRSAAKKQSRLYLFPLWGREMRSVGLMMEIEIEREREREREQLRQRERERAIERESEREKERERLKAGLGGGSAPAQLESQDGQRRASCKVLIPCKSPNSPTSHPK